MLSLRGSREISLLTERVRVLSAPFTLGISFLDRLHGNLAHACAYILLTRLRDYVCTRVSMHVRGSQQVPTYHLPGRIHPIKLDIVLCLAGLLPHLRDLRSRTALGLRQPFASIGVEFP